jgi:hypothetical protein
VWQGIDTALHARTPRLADSTTGAHIALSAHPYSSSSRARAFEWCATAVRAASRGGQTRATFTMWGGDRKAKAVVCWRCKRFDLTSDRVRTVLLYSRYVMLLEMLEMAAGVVDDTETHPVN